MAKNKSGKTVTAEQRKCDAAYVRADKALDQCHTMCDRINETFERLSLAGVNARKTPSRETPCEEATSIVINMEVALADAFTLVAAATQVALNLSQAVQAARNVQAELCQPIV